MNFNISANEKNPEETFKNLIVHIVIKNTHIHSTTGT